MKYMWLSLVLIVLVLIVVNAAKAAEPVDIAREVTTICGPSGCVDCFRWDDGAWHCTR